MVVEDDSSLKGPRFKSRRSILDGHFFTLICCKNCIVCLKRLKINKKEAGVGPFLEFFKKDLLFIISNLFCSHQSCHFPHSREGHPSSFY